MLLNKKENESERTGVFHVRIKTKLSLFTYIAHGDTHTHIRSS